MMMLAGPPSPYTAHEVLYDVSDAVRPRLLCNISNTSAHLFTGDTFEYLKPVSGSETDVILHSLGSGNESLAGKFPYYANSGSWLPDLTVMAYTIQVSVDNANYPAGGTQVWLYSQHHTAPLFTYRNGFGDCICRFGLPTAMLAVSPDGQYVVAGRMAGKGSVPLAVYRVSDRGLAATLEPSVVTVLWARAGHRLFIVRFGTEATQSWTPEVGVSNLARAGSWAYLPGLSPDGSQVAYTAYADPNTSQKVRTNVYDLKAGSTRVLVDSPRSQVLFVKDGWVWYLEEAQCDPMTCGAPWGTQPTGKVFAMQLSAATETEVTFAAGENPVTQAGAVDWLPFAPGEFWPAA